MRFELFGIKFVISYFFMTALLVFIINDKSGIYLPLFFSVCLHEFSHFLFLCLFGVKINEISLVPGLVGVNHSNFDTKCQELICLIAGPLSNMLAGAVFHLFQFDEFYIINLILGVFNLLPVTGLDGGSIVYALLEGKLSHDKINLVLKLLSLIMAILVAGLFFFLLYNNHTNYSLLIFALYLIIPFFMKIT